MRFLLCAVTISLVSQFTFAETIRLKPLVTAPVTFGMPDGSVNLWAKGAGPKDRWQFPKGFRVHAVAQLWIEDESQYRMVRTFRLNRENDYIGTYQLDALQPGQNYKYRIGYCISVPVQEISQNDDFDFQDCSTGSFTTDDPNAEEISFIFSSCRLYAKLGSMTLFGTGEKADQVFGKILEDMRHNPTDFYLSVGDHIYYDRLGPFCRATSLEKMRQLYQGARSYPYMSRLMSSSLFYAMGDDHDMHVDNSNYAKRMAEPDIFANGIRAYQEYQYYGGPEAKADHFWHTFSRGCADFFVMDTRTERDERIPYIISDTQYEAFEAWITSHSRRGRVSFIVTPCPLLGENGNADGWTSCPEQQANILKLIAARHNAFILTGDAHATRCGSYDLFDENDENLGNVTELMSSGLKSMTFATEDNFPDELDLRDAGGLKCVRTDRSNLHPNFTRPKANQGLLRQVVGKYVKGVFMRITVNKRDSDLKAIIHDTNDDSTEEKNYPLVLKQTQKVIKRRTRRAS